MSYELKKPYINEKSKIDFIFYANMKGLKIVETELFLFALEPNEIMGEKDIEIDVVNPETGETHKETIKVPYPIINSNYEDEQKEIRKAQFLSKFFKVPLDKSIVSKGYAYYRKEPKGYSSAIESMSFAERMCSKLGGLPEGTLKFYKEPNFTKPEQCTEEWLVENQIALPALSVEDFDTLFIAFGQAWNTQEH